MVMANKKDYDYFVELEKMCNYSYEAAVFVKRTLSNFDAKALKQSMIDVHEIEHSADIKNHDMMQRLGKAFITPIEREDIISLARNIDSVTDAVEDILIRAYIFNVKTIKPEAVEFAKLVTECCVALKEVLKEFRNFRKSTALQNTIIEVNRLEGEGDALYARAVRNLYLSSKDPVELLVWTELYSRLEKCCDACEDVAEAVELAVMKNT